MATWSGWVGQFLSAANLPNSADNVRFMNDWADHANTNCRNNPVDVSRAMPGSSNCASLTASRTAQNYASRAQAALAWSRQLNSGNFPHLLAGLTNDTLTDKAKLPAVLDDLTKWGSTKFVAELERESGVNAGGGGGGGGGTPQGIAPTTLKGLHDMKRSFASFGNKAQQARANTTAALSMLHRRRRVSR